MCGVHACVCCGVDYAYMYTYVTCGHLYMSEGDGRCLLLFSALFSCDSISHCSMVFQLIWLASEPLQCDDLLTPSPPGTEGSNQAIHMGAGDLRIQILMRCMRNILTDEVIYQPISLPFTLNIRNL